MGGYHYIMCGVRYTMRSKRVCVCVSVLQSASNEQCESTGAHQVYQCGTGSPDQAGKSFTGGTGKRETNNCVSWRLII